MSSVVAFECAEGYELVGSSFRTFKFDGEWDGEPVACKGKPIVTSYSLTRKSIKTLFCLVRDCGQPPDIPSAIIKFSSTTFNSKAYFRYDIAPNNSISHT